MKNYLGLSWRDQPAPKKSHSGKEQFNEALLILGGKLCKADGKITPDEIAVFKTYFGIDDEAHPGVGKIIMEAANSADGIGEAAERIFNLFDGKTEPLEYILTMTSS